MQKTLSIVIVNWNSGHFIENCFQSIEEHYIQNVKSVIVIDNFSSDNSLEFFEQNAKYSFDFHLIYNDDNMGFAYACNQGAKISNTDYILFLNPDCALNKFSIKGPIDYLSNKNSENVAVLGIQMIDEFGEVSKSCARFPTPLMFFAQALGLDYLPMFQKLSTSMKDWDHKNTQFVDHVIGAFYFIKKDIFNEMGGFDENFFVYLEDLDLSYRIKNFGKDIVYLSEYSAFHHGGGTSSNVKSARLFYSLRSKIIYSGKHFNKLEYLQVIACCLLIEPFSRMVLAFRRGGAKEIHYTFIAFKMLWLWLFKKQV